MIRSLVSKKVEGMDHNRPHTTMVDISSYFASFVENHCFSLKVSREITRGWLALQEPENQVPGAREVTSCGTGTAHQVSVV